MPERGLCIGCSGAAGTAPFEPDRPGALVIGFSGTVALWWCYFQRAEGVGVDAAERSEDAGAVGLWCTWTLTVIVVALIAIAVADELAIAHPGGEALAGFRVLGFGGPALFLVAQLVFHRLATGHYSRARVAGLVALAMLGVLTSSGTLIVGIAASTAVLVASDTVHGAAPEPVSAQ